MAYISKIKVPGVETAYLIKDNEGRLMIAPAYSSSTSYSEGDYYVKDGIGDTPGKFYKIIGGEEIETTVSAELQSIKQSIAGAMHYIGVTKTTLEEGANPDHLDTLDENKNSLTKTTGFVSGDVVLAPVPKGTGKSEMYYEYVYNGKVWSEFGSTNPIGKMAYANEAKGINTIDYEVPVYTGGTISVNEYSGDDESAVYIKPTSVVGSVDVATTTSASSVKKKNKYLGTTKIWTGDSTAAVTRVTATKKGLATTEIFGVEETGAALTEVTANTMRLGTTDIYGVEKDTVDASKVGATYKNIQVGDTALTTVVTGFLSEPVPATSSNNPFVGADVVDECLSWFESPLETTQIRGVAYQTIDVQEVTIKDVTGIAQKANSTITVATGALVNKTEDGGAMVAISVTGTTDSFAKKGATGTIVATGQLSDNGSDIVTGIDYNSVRNFVRSDRYMDVATGQLSDSEGGANIADAIEITQVDGLVTGLSVKNKDNVLQKVWSGETGATGLLTGLKSEVREFQAPVVKNGNETYSVETEITVQPYEAPKYLTMTLPEGSPETQISINKNGEPVGTNIQYRVNNGKWNDWDFTSSRPIYAKANDVIQWKGVNPEGLSAGNKDYPSNYIYFDIPNEVHLSGNVMSLIDGIGKTKVIPCNYCFEFLFNGTKIKTVSKDLLPATTLTEFCYSYMFAGCSSLVDAPELPATTLAEGCYGFMFGQCTSLTTAPALPATTLAGSCYMGMFFMCTSLENAPALPATTLVEGCYGMMFGQCTSLITSPELPATTLADSCYEMMFSMCSKLQNVTCLATDISAAGCTNNWLSGVASEGTFVKASGFDGWSRDVNGIPEGWNVIVPKYLTMTLPTSSPTTQISINKRGTPVGTNIQYRVNNGKWNAWNFTSSRAISANANDVIQWRGDNPDGLSQGYDNYIYFDIPNEVHLSGNVMSLIDGVGDTEVIPCNYCFCGLFENTNIKTVTEDFLPATTLADSCYSSMFYGCSSLVNAPSLPATKLANSCYEDMFFECTSLMTAPALPATTLTDSCYSSMFSRCTSLATAPELKATTLADNCYEDMFIGCTSLATAPELPATTLADNCYSGMLRGCTSLTAAPSLPATTLAVGCYNYMFAECTSLTAAPALPATTLAISCYRYMFDGCSSLVTAPELKATTLAISCCENMFSRCTSLATAPELKATTLAQQCYYQMFAGCSNLQNVTCLATDKSAVYCTLYWLKDVASTGTFNKAAGVTWSSGISGIPSGWTVNDYVQPANELVE